jgi:hypothetical protein
MATLKGVNFNPTHVASFKDAEDFVKNEQPDSKKQWNELFGITDDDLKQVYAMCVPTSTETPAIDTKKKNPNG